MPTFGVSWLYQMSSCVELDICYSSRCRVGAGRQFLFATVGRPFTVACTCTTGASTRWEDAACCCMSVGQCLGSRSSNLGFSLIFGSVSVVHSGYLLPILAFAEHRATELASVYTNTNFSPTTLSHMCESSIWMVGRHASHVVEPAAARREASNG